MVDRKLEWYIDSQDDRQIDRQDSFFLNQLTSDSMDRQIDRQDGRQIARMIDRQDDIYSQNGIQIARMIDRQIDKTASFLIN